MPFLAKIASLLLFTQAFCDERHVDLPLSPMYVIDITQKAVDWTVDQFSARFRGLSTRSGYLCRHVDDKKPRASSLRDSKHKKGCFYVIRY